MFKTYKYLDLPPLSDLSKEEIGGKRYYLLPNGNKVPSVTTVLGHFKKKSLHEWRQRVGHEEANRVSRVASTHGNKLHNIIEKILKNDSNALNESKKNPALHQALIDLSPWLNKIDNIHYVEAPLYSTKMRIAGRVDLIAEYQGVPVIIDFKTSARPKKAEWIQEYFEQETAYAIMYEELTGFPIEFIITMLVSPDGPQVFLKRKENFIKPLANKIYQYYLDTHQ